MKFRTIFAACLTVGGLAVLGPAARSACAQTSFEFRYGTRESPLEGQRFNTMRAIAHYLDEQADHFRQQVEASTPRLSRNEARLVGSVREFARRAANFHDRMDAYADSPWDVPNEVVKLDRRARAVNDRIRYAVVFRHSFQDWRQVLDTLNSMKQLLAGYDVRVPPAHPGFRDYDRDYGDFHGQPDGHVHQHFPPGGSPGSYTQPPPGQPGTYTRPPDGQPPAYPPPPPQPGTYTIPPPHRP